MFAPHVDLVSDATGLFTLAGYIAHDTTGASQSPRRREAGAIVQRYRLGSIEPKTINRYCQLWRYRWVPFAVEASVPVFPLRSTDIEAFLAELAEHTQSPSTTSDALAALRWVEYILRSPSRDASNAEHDRIVQSARKRFGSPARPSATPSPRVIADLFDWALRPERTAAEIRGVAIVAVMVATAIRKCDVLELAHLDVIVHTRYIEIFVAQSKTDRFRHGAKHYMARGQHAQGADKVLLRLLELTGHAMARSDTALTSPIFRQTRYCKAAGHTVYMPHRGPTQRAISSATAARDIRRALLAVGHGDVGITPHGFRSASATMVYRACDKDMELVKLHGKWITDSSATRYVEHGLDELIETSLRLGDVVAAERPQRVTRTITVGTINVSHIHPERRNKGTDTGTRKRIAQRATPVLVVD